MIIPAVLTQNNLQAHTWRFAAHRRLGRSHRPSAGTGALLPLCLIIFSEDFSKDFSASASSLDEVLFSLRFFLESLGDNLDMMLPLGKR